MSSTKDRFKKQKCCVIIPTYNNAAFLQKVIDDVLQYTDDLIVVNDGSTDATASILSKYTPQIDIVEHSVNKGKGRSLKDGFQYARSQGYDYAITMDSDGQHFASDIPSFLDELEKDGNTLVIGTRNMQQEHVPGKSSFGNKFSNFWYRVETGIKLDDTQSGFRLYPIRELEKINFITGKFEFEVEVIVKAAWRGINVKNIPIRVHYEPGKLRVSHFRPVRDFSRISVLNTYLVILAFFYYIPFRFYKSLIRENIKRFIKTHFLNKEEPISRKAWSIGFGVFMGIVPIWGYQLLVGIALAHLMKLNKAIFVVAANISVPPMIPLIIYVSYMMGGQFVANPKNDILFSEGISLDIIKHNLYQYAIGATVLALLTGLCATALAYVILLINRKLRLDSEISVK